MEPSASPDRLPPLRLSRVDRRPRQAGPAIAAVALGLALAILKPWAAAGPRADPSSGPAEAALAATPAPLRGEHDRLTLLSGPSGTAQTSRSPSTPSPTPDPPGVVRCLAPSGWRLVTDQRTAGREVRSWIVVQPATAGSPSDPTIQPVVLGAGLVGLGLCAPASLEGRGPWAALAPRLSGLWRLTPTSAQPLPLLPLDPRAALTGAEDGYDGPVTFPRLGRPVVLYGPGRPAAPGASWPGGRYVAAIREPGTDVLLWFGFTITSRPVP